MFALRHADMDVTVAEGCHKRGISKPTYYKWKNKHSGLGVPELHRLKHLQEENQHLANLSLDK